jgi:hypothetical protein
VTRVAIGRPVLPRERSVGRAIESVLGQTHTDFELVVSDNASTDGTSAVCRSYATADARVRYTRRPSTIPAYENFRFVFHATSAPYFMWLSGDDHMVPSLLEDATAILDTRPEVACCVPRVEFEHPDGSRSPAAGTVPLLGTAAQNLCRFLEDPMDNSRFYGVHRREILRTALPSDSFHAFDWVISAISLMAGTHWQLDRVGLVREASEPDKYLRALDAASPRLARRLLPLAPFTCALLADQRTPRSMAVLYRLFRLNAIYHVTYCQYRYPRYGGLAHWVGSTVERVGRTVAARVVRR